ncbi:hypothetical protein [Hyphobacterium sp.]|uniref:hypothetical protein n=1 Tax=Hyphobacterium sp. TaxID=2004662 RepID=UPI003747D0C6
MQLILKGFSDEDCDRLHTVIVKALERSQLEFDYNGHADLHSLAEPEGDKIALLAYSTPGVSIASAMAQGIDPEIALAEWIGSASHARALVDAAPDKICLIDSDLAAAYPERLLAALGIRTGVTLDAAGAGVPELRNSILVQESAERWARSCPEANDQLEALDTAALTTGLRRKALAPDGFLAAARARLSQASRPVDLVSQVEALSAALDMCQQDVAALEAAGARPVNEQTGRYPLSTTSNVASRPSKGNVFKRVIRRARRSSNLKLIKNSDLFDADWYVEKYPDVVQFGGDPALHYLLNGGFEGRAAGPKFNTHLYLQLNPDLEGSPINPLVHYLRRGRIEGRIAMDMNGNRLGVGPGATP